MAATTSATGAADDGADDGAGHDDGSQATTGDPGSGSGGDDGSSDGGSDPTTGAGDGSSEGGSGDPPATCMGHGGQPGLLTGETLMFDGMERSYDLFVPTSYDPNDPAPLVLNYHGLYDSPALQMARSKLNDVAEPHGMIVAYPQGIGASHNAGGCCGDAQAQGIDDVGYARALVEHLEQQMCIDATRVYATGMSNGGHMAHTLACEAADVFAATASVAGVLTFNPADCQPSRPISVMDFHGTTDPIVPFGGTGIGFPAVPTMMADWAARDGCSGQGEVTFSMGDTECTSYPSCSGGVEVTLCVTDGGGHCWPGADSCLFGHVTDVLSASETMVTMFEQQTL